MAKSTLAAAEKNTLKQARQIVFVDESGFYLVAGKVRSYAPIGQPLVLRPKLTRDHLSVISAVTPAGQLFCQMSLQPLDRFAVVQFLEHLLRHIQAPLWGIWDGSRIHWNDDMDAFFGSLGRAQIVREQLPAYAPELNPDEGVWNYLKNVEMGDLACTSLPPLRLHLRRALMRLRTQPLIIRSLLLLARLCYVARCVL